MNKKFNRRDLLRIAGIGSGGVLLSGINDNVAESLVDEWEWEASGKRSEVRITGVEMLRVEVPVPEEQQKTVQYNKWAVAKITTDAGITGYAFGRDRIYHLTPPEGYKVIENGIRRFGLGERYTPEELQRLREILIGNSPFAVERFLQQGFGQFAAFEHALWDLIGKITGTSVYSLLGGAQERIKVYLTVLWDGKNDQSDIPYERQAEDLLFYKRQGFGAAKIRCWRPNPMDDVEALKVIKKAVGNDFGIMFDRTAQFAQWTWDYETARKVAFAMQENGAGWLEEPFHTDDFINPARLAAELEMPITGGEHYFGLAPFAKCLANKVYDIVQPDGFLAGGILTIKKIGAMAQAFNSPCFLHGTNSLSLAGWLQIAGLMPNCPWEEIALVRPPLLPQQMWEPGLKLLKTPTMFSIHDGFIDIPQGPGLGLDINEDALKEYQVG